MHSLYICYFGLREPLVQTQVLPYLRQLIKRGIGIHLLTFEPNLSSGWSELEKNEWRERLRSEGINWSALAYHKSPSLPATLYDIVIGSAKALSLANRENIGLLHARAHIPLVMALIAKPLTGCRVVFDIRGLIADEYVDAGIWKERSMVYRVFKWIEMVGVKKADQIVVLTEKLRTWLIDKNPALGEKIEVIPCCADFNRFYETDSVENGDERKIEGNGDGFTVIYAGSVTGLYLLEEMARFFLAIKKKRSDAKLKILTTSEKVGVVDTLYRCGLNDGDFWVGSVPPSEVPKHLQMANVGLSFRKATFSQMAASPTKIAEYLAAGLPVITNAGIGDSDGFIEKDRVGVVLRNFSELEMNICTDRLEALLGEKNIVSRCRESARRHFDLEAVGGVRYWRVYQKIADAAMLNPSAP